MTLNLTTIMAAAQSHAAASGHFDRVNGHEPRNAPGKGLSVAFWLEDLRPVPAQSGLNATSVRIGLSARIYLPMVVEPQDGIDPAMLAAADALMRAYSADFDLGGLVESVDLLGRHGEPLAGKAGYLEQDGTEYRVFVITLPLVVNDLWPQVNP